MNFFDPNFLFLIKILVLIMVKSILSLDKTLFITIITTQDIFFKTEVMELMNILKFSNLLVFLIRSRFDLLRKST